jgi:hypothetical protein
MNYGVKDLYSYGGFILGASVAGLLARQQGVDGRFTLLIISVVAGLACGFVGEKLYSSRRGGGGPPAPPAR